MDYVDDVYDMDNVEDVDDVDNVNNIDDVDNINDIDNNDNNDGVQKNLVKMKKIKVVPNWLKWRENWSKISFRFFGPTPQIGTKKC